MCAFPSWLKEGKTKKRETDSFETSQQFVTQFEENLKQAKAHGKLTIQGVNRAYREARILSLCCKTGEQALLLFRQSPKIVQDLETRILLGLSSVKYPAVLTLRKWEEKVYLHPEWEFRCFVRQGKLTAITPIIVWLFNEDVTRNQAKIKQTISTFVDNILLPNVPFKTFVADLYLYFGASEFSLDIISVFPFDRQVHTGLFSWEQDQLTLLNGPTEFRVLSKPPAAEVSILPREWQKFVTDKYGLDFSEVGGLDVYKSSRCPIS